MDTTACYQKRLRRISGEEIYVVQPPNSVSYIIDRKITMNYASGYLELVLIKDTDYDVDIMEILSDIM